jgi:hypothetical protein
VPFGVHAEAEHLAMVAAVHVLEPGRRAGDAAALRMRVRPATMAAEAVLHDLGVVPMLSSDSQGMGRIGEVVRRAFQSADWMKRVRGGDGGPGPADNARVLRHLAKVCVNPAIAHGLAGHVGSLAPGRLADAVLWRPELFAVRPELVVKAGVAAWGASGDPNASTMLAEPVLLRPQVGALGAAAAQRSLAFLARAALDAELPTSRPRAAVEATRELTAADMLHHGRLGEVRVDPRTHEVTLDGEPVGDARITKGGSAVFPITGGNVTYYEPGSVSPYVQGMVQHDGSGLSLEAGGTRVELTDFVVDPGRSVLTGTVSVDGEVAAESAPLFFLDGRTLNPLEVRDNGTAVLQGTTVKLKAEAAELLNETFGIDDLQEGMVIGVATITVNTR